MGKIAPGIIVGVVGAALLVAGVVAAVTRRADLSGFEHLSVNQRTEALSVQFLGTSSLVIGDGEDVLVLDGFVSRPSLWRVLAQPLEPDVETVRTAMRQTGVEAVSAVLVTHSHYDHALDAAEWVRQGGGSVWGTVSSARLARAGGVAAKVVAPGEVHQVGRFHIRFFDLDHAPPERMKGEVAEDFFVPARTGEYRTGGGLGYHITHADCRMLFIPSAGRAHADLTAFPADVVFLSVGQLGRRPPVEIERYWRETVVASGTPLVVPIHWDDFTRPLSRPLVPLPNGADRADLALSAIRQLAQDRVRVALPPVFAPLDLGEGPC